MTAYRKAAQIDVSYGHDAEGNPTHTKIVLKVNGVVRKTFGAQVVVLPTVLFEDLSQGITSAVGSALF